ncbi:protein-disulfide reductase DsbD N-terminal domain-containing protein [Psychrobacter sp. N25K4-3-2]|uniref:protein-disulfide reductase DsbD N-terminal domain-containing protein n=1 Tax=Psychrobacter sp. N25K4-3-2 TaxID=2785026 RepID=UPI00188CF364|nr:protein-disulfide reductase DsbD N-terminal domain-containing protein [Psychrobacter sp. N25K4-3-2]MBF4490192.1 protein-disulfide reductase DsbD N-terminal domain-containing protein [Psychrobacter sp. N25K4-3-2]
MPINTPFSKMLISKVLTIKATAKKPCLLSFVLLGSTLLTGLTATSMTVQAAGLSDLFSNNNSASQSKFLPVDQAFQVISSTKATSKGTRLSIAFEITPGHYVYKDKLTLRFPKGVSATPFTFNQSPVSIDDPTFGKVSVFTQRSVIATTTLITSNGKGAKNVPVIIGWQGCATAGLCYPPEKVKTKINIAATRR